MKLPFPSRQPSVLHSSPLWLLARSTGLSQVCFGDGEAALHVTHTLKKNKKSEDPNRERLSFTAFLTDSA